MENSEPVKLPTEPTVPPSEIPKPTSHVLLIVGVSLIVVITAAYFILQPRTYWCNVCDNPMVRIDTRFNRLPTPTPAVTKTLLPMLTEDNETLTPEVASQIVPVSPTPMTSWKTYTDPINNFSFSYPDFFPVLKLRVKTYGEESNPDTYESVYLDPQQTGGGPGYTVALKLYDTGITTQNLKQYITKKEYPLQGDYGSGPLPTLEKTMTQGAKELIILEEKPQEPHVDSSRIHVYFTVQNKVFILTYQTAISDLTQEGKYQLYLDQILSSLKFTK